LKCIEIKKPSLRKLYVAYYLSICLPGRVSWFLVFKIWSPYVRTSETVLCYLKFL